MTPSLKVMKMETNSLIMTSGSAKSDVDWDAGDSGESTGLLFDDYGNSNGTSPDWDF